MADCINGKVTILECPPQDDCECVGVKSIVFNANNTLTVTLTNGVSYTSGSLKGTTGATGAAGADGVDTSLVLFSNFDTSPTTGTVVQTFANKTYTMPAGTMSKDGDYLDVFLRFNTTTANLLTPLKYFDFAPLGQTVAATTPFAGQVFTVMVKARYHRVSNATVYAEFELIAVSIVGFFTLKFDLLSSASVITFGGLNLDNVAYTFRACADSVAIGDVNCNEMVIKLNKA